MPVNCLTRALIAPQVTAQDSVQSLYIIADMIYSSKIKSSLLQTPMDLEFDSLSLR